MAEPDNTIEYDPDLHSFDVFNSDDTTAEGANAAVASDIAVQEHTTSEAFPLLDHTVGLHIDPEPN